MSAVYRFARKWKTGTPLAAALGLLVASAPAWSADEAATASANTADPTLDMAKSTTTGRVARAMFTTAIADREPVDEIKTLPNSVDRVFFFSDLRELDGQIVTHRWEYAGETKAEVTFKVGNGARWRVYSSKNLLPEWTGTWTVVVSTKDGQALQTSTFEYTAK